MNKVDDKITKIIGRLEKLVEAEGANAIKLGITATRTYGISYLIIGIIAAACSAALFSFGYSQLQLLDANTRPYLGPVIFTFLIAGAFGLGATVTLFTADNWIAAFAPKQRLAGKVLKL